MVLTRSVHHLGVEGKSPDVDVIRYGLTELFLLSVMTQSGFSRRPRVGGRNVDLVVRLVYLFLKLKGKSEAILLILFAWAVFISVNIARTDNRGVAVAAVREVAL